MCKSVYRIGQLRTVEVVFKRALGRVYVIPIIGS